MLRELVNISVNLPESYLMIMRTLIKEGPFTNRSEIVRKALERYLNLDLDLNKIIHVQEEENQ